MNEPVRGDRCFGVIHNPMPRRKRIMTYEGKSYDDMNVHELVHAAMNEGWLRRIEPGSDGEFYLPAIESALRKAVVREASVGAGTVRRAGEAPLPDAPQMFVPWETKDGDYDLIPKETVTVQDPEDTEAYTKMVKIMVYWKGRYEMAVRGMTDNAAIEIMGKEP